MKGFGLIATLVLVLGICGIIPIHHAAAQSLPADDPLTISVNPQYPSPYDAVTITPGSTLIDLSSSIVTISVNGSVVQKGSGTTPAQIQAGGPGVPTTIKITAVTNDGHTYTKSLVIHPADVALIVEPRSTSHPFYRGAALVASNGNLRIVAIPDLRTSSGAAIPASSLVYTWKFGDQLLTDASGIGKSTFIATAPVKYRDATIDLTVTSQDNSVVAESSIVISPVDPIVRIYQNDPLLGPLFNSALPDTIAMSDAEDTFRAVPYYFTGIPSLAWTVNSAQSQTGKDITVRSTGAGTGTSILGFVATEGDQQRAETSMTVQFGAKKSLGIFGL